MDDGAPPTGQQLELRRAGDAGSAISASWRPSSLNEERRTVELTWTTGADVLRQDPWANRTYIERLIVSPEAVDLSRLNAGGALLDSHDRASVRNQIGVVESASVSDGVGHATVRFASDPESDLVFRKVAEGIARGISVGYTVGETRVTENDDGPDLHEVTSWMPFELSAVSIGADAGAQVRSHTNYTADRAPQKDRLMETNTNGGAPRLAAITQAKTEERERVSYIDEMCGKLSLPAEFRRELIASDLNLTQVQDRVINAAADLADETEVDGHHCEHVDNRGRSFAEDAAEGLLVRERIIPDVKSPGARQFVDANFSDIAERTLSLAGVNTRTIRDKPTLFARAFNTSSSLADTLATFSTRSLMSGYLASPRTFDGAFRESVSRNFKPNERIRVSDTPALAPVAEGAEFQEVLLSDRKESFTVGKFGHILAYTIEAMVNDDLGAIAREAERAGFAAAVTESNVFWSVITTNANMSDTTPIFDAGEGNLVTGVALTADALEDAREYFRGVETENAVKLNLSPRYLFVAPNLERTAEKLVSPPVNHSTATLGDVLSNAYASQLELRVESRLPAGDWMLAVDFRQIDTLEFAWLEGRRGVFVDQDGDFTTMGIKFRVADIFGAGAIDRKGIYYSDAA